MDHPIVVLCVLPVLLYICHENRVACKTFSLEDCWLMFVVCRWVKQQLLHCYQNCSTSGMCAY